MEFGCGTNLVLFFLVLVRRVVAETHECGSSDPTLARPGNSGGKQLGRALSKVQNGIALCWTKRMTSIERAFSGSRTNGLAAGKHGPHGASR